MENHTSERLVHYFDTEQHRVLCGARRPEDRSTKHARGITCAACIGRLREHAGAETEGRAAVGGEAVAGGEHAL